MSEEQKNYEAQDQQNQQGSETKKACLDCCCSYLKGSVKAGCQLFECIAGCA